MKTLTMFYLEDCPYCINAFKAIDELSAENPQYKEIEIEKIEESLDPVLADQYDYYYVPSFYDGHTKLSEAHPSMGYKKIKAEVQRVLDYALA